MKNIIITGAAGNLGTSVVNRFLRGEYRVIAVVQDQHQKNSLPPSEKLEVHVVDLGNEKAASSFIEKIISNYQKIDGGLMLVGGFTMGDISKTSGDDLKKQYALNFETAYYTAHPLFIHMLQNNYGRLIFVGARPALDANAGKNMIAYALSKSLIFKLAEFINAAAKGKNVTATVFVPSTIDTPQNRQSMPDANPDNWVKATEIADLMEMVCSETGNPLREAVMKVYANA